MPKIGSVKPKHRIVNLQQGPNLQKFLCEWAEYQIDPNTNLSSYNNDLVTGNLYDADPSSKLLIDNKDLITKKVMTITSVV